MRVVGYVRVSTDEQADSGVGLDAQRTAIVGECARRGWRLVAVHTDAGVSGKSMKGRPALAEALHAVESGQAEGIVVAKLDRLSPALPSRTSMPKTSLEASSVMTSILCPSNRREADLRP
jgi:DNA invertase Pin-like site-specific DNA recombinase